MPSGTTLTPHPGLAHTMSSEAVPAGERIVRPSSRRVVVGVDDSPDTGAALEWAAAEAQARGVDLHIAHIWSWPRLEPWTHTIDRTVIADLKQQGRLIVEKYAEVARTYSGLTITAETGEGYAPDVLAKQGEDAGLIVVGAHRRSALSRAVMGSVSSALVARATCPVVVYAAPSGLPAEETAVVVGVTGSEDDERLLEFAFAHASRHHRRLRALYFWNPPFADATLPPPARAQAWLSEALAGWQERFPDVEIHTAVVRDHPVDGLVAASASQDLVVVGRRSPRLRLGGLLGSVSLGVLHHATCPVAVVPPTEHSIPIDRTESVGPTCTSTSRGRSS